jgi:hypothetical protein
VGRTYTRTIIEEKKVRMGRKDRAKVKQAYPGVVT